MSLYNWQHEGWPNFQWDAPAIQDRLQRYCRDSVALVDRIRLLPEEEVHAYLLERLVEEARSTSSIEGEIMSRHDLMSSVMNNLNLGGHAKSGHDLRAKAIGQQMILNRDTFSRPLTESTLKYWHELLLGYENRLTAIGEYRQGLTPMRIVSGPDYRQEIHFEAPPADRVPSEMQPFIDYCNTSRPQTVAGVTKAGVAHLWFESIHPFEDGNGRIGRAVMEKMLSQSLGVFVPFSLSHAIERRRKEYYAALNASSHSLDITPWMVYFSEVLLEALNHANQLVTFTLRKHEYLTAVGNQLSDHERKAIGKMLEAGPSGFQGGMTTKKYMRITRVSQPTAARALKRLSLIGALLQRGRGRATHYVLPFGGDAQ
ncbi:Fic family protein [Lewinella marina]|uniref:Fic family protein n=1 Tax=Neolewinella marina TaxID=438751 RepID=UPI0014309A95|nr:DUF4172 domain-containing protein [Neolewinella marina]NJB87087.1 Fic family protein [Neolewinella marina]